MALSFGILLFLNRRLISDFKLKIANLLKYKVALVRGHT